MVSAFRMKSTKEVQIKGGSFDPDFYRANYSDADNAVESGFYPSAYAHFLEEGMEKGYYSKYTGTAEEFNEENYLAAYSDIAEQVESGKYRSGAHLPFSTPHHTCTQAYTLKTLH